jgi:hypothetical protein
MGLTFRSNTSFLCHCFIIKATHFVEEALLRMMEAFIDSYFKP